MAVGSTSGSFSPSANMPASCSASSSRPCVAAVKYVNDSEKAQRHEARDTTEKTDKRGQSIYEQITDLINLQTNKLGY